MEMLAKPSVYTLPVFRLTKIDRDDSAKSLSVALSHKGRKLEYKRAPITPTSTRWTEFSKIPIVLNSAGEPWTEACMWLLSKAQANPFNITSLRPIAQDLAAYLLFLEEFCLEWDDFSSIDKYTRPTYLYKNYLQDLLNNNPNTKKTLISRRMNSVIGLYRFLISNKTMRFNPKNPPWVESKTGIKYIDHKGFNQIKMVDTTDISIKNSRSEDPVSEHINDGGKLKPLSIDEQKSLILALKKVKNIECTLMHYLAILTGARIMTALTFKYRHVAIPPDQIKQWPHKIKCGPGTGIDTKFNKSDVYLVVARTLYEELHAYAVSERARRRRKKTICGDDLNNYLFLTQRGQPYYETKIDRNILSSQNLRRSVIDGRALRSFITKNIIPILQKSHPNFKYSFHDLRATFGMNWVDYHTNKSASNVNSSEKFSAIEQLKKLMWHKSSETTEKYLNYRSNLEKFDIAQKEWSEHLLKIIKAS